MPDLAWNERGIRAAKCIDGKRTQYTIRGGKGLMLEVQPSGARSWLVRYRLRVANTRLDRRYVIGDAEVLPVTEAADLAAEVMRAVEAGGDPFAERQAKRKGDFKVETFGDLFTHWLEKHAKQNVTSWPEQEKRYQRHLEGPLGGKALIQIDRDDIATIRDAVFDGGAPYESNTVVSLFNRIMNFGVEERQLNFNPAQRLRKRQAEEPRTRTIPPADLALLWHLEGASVMPVMKSIIRILILSGQRRGEVAGARTAELSLAAITPGWLIPAWRDREKQERGTKNGHPHFVPLPPMLMTEFQAAIEAANATSFVFPGRYGSDGPISDHAVTVAMRRACIYYGIAAVSPHDIRRTVGTELAQLGVGPDRRALIFNHISSKTVTTKHYDSYDYIPEKLAALAAWEARVKAIIG